MKITTLWLITLIFLASCETQNNLENTTAQIEAENQVTTQDWEIESQDISQNQETEISTLIAEEVLAEDLINGQELISNLELSNSQLSEIEIESLLLMREEEKLARDVYLELYDTWGQKIFTNIAASEQTHTDAVKVLLEKYNIEDPVIDDTRGVFASSLMQELYDNLTTQWKTSLLDALIVGATIEDLDIKDLQEAAEQTDKADIIAVYANLERGSRNHMRSFIKNITGLGETYIPQYISQSNFDAIVSSKNERGGNSLWGNPGSWSTNGNWNSGNGKNKY